VAEVGSLYSAIVSRYLPTSSLMENVEYSAEYHRPEVRRIYALHKAINCMSRCGTVVISECNFGVYPDGEQFSASDRRGHSVDRQQILTCSMLTRIYKIGSENWGPSSKKIRTISQLDREHLRKEKR